jgi:hypothetical protein
LKHHLNMDDKRLIVTKSPEPKNTGYGSASEQRIDKATEMPMWNTQVVVMDEDGGTVINITTIGSKPPDVEVDDEVIAHRLEAIPWHASGRSGVAYKADVIDVVDD